MPVKAQNLDNTNNNTYAPDPSKKHRITKDNTAYSFERLNFERLNPISLDNADRVNKLVKELDENKKEQKEIFARRKDLERKAQRNKLKQKQKKWFNRDAASGTIAAGGISALYTGVEYLRNFLPPGIANLILPFFILADVGSAVSAWKIALYNKKIKALKRNAPTESTWAGSRNSLLRAIFETVWATIGSAVVLGAIVTSTFMAAAAAGAFAVFIAPVFMLVLGTRTIFNSISSGFNFIRSHIAKTKANQHPVGSKERHQLEKQADRYHNVAKIQAIAASTSAIGFVATTLVMLTHHFSFGFVGIAGGLALGGFMGYLFRGNSKYSSFLKKKREGIDIEMNSIDSKANTLELTQTEKSKKLVGFIPNLVDLAKKVGQFMLPVGAPEQPVDVPEQEATAKPENVDAPRSSYEGITLKLTEADITKIKHPEKTPAITVIEVSAGDRTVKIPVNSDDGAVITKTRFGIYTPRRAEAAETEAHQSMKMASKS